MVRREGFVVMVASAGVVKRLVEAADHRTMLAQYAFVICTGVEFVLEHVLRSQKRRKAVAATAYLTQMQSSPPTAIFFGLLVLIPRLLSKLHRISLPIFGVEVPHLFILFTHLGLVLAFCEGFGYIFMPFDLIFFDSDAHSVCGNEFLDLGS